MKSIFIIEDHPVMRNGLADYFIETDRWQVKGTASSIPEAKKLLSSVCADVILLDIQLNDEGGCGLDIIPWFSNQNTTNPVFAVYSAFFDYAHVSSALSLGVQAYITKRRNQQELETILLESALGKTYIDEKAQIKLKNVTDLFSLLTNRESEILILVKNGLSNKKIAEELGISRRTVENILSCVYNKTGINSRLDLQKL